jgi:DNA-binding Xre family transcriptional regulator
MAIENRLPELVAKKYGAERVNVNEVQRAVGLTYSTVHGWLNGHVSRADFPVLNAWCKYLNCAVGDILVYTPDE